MGVHYLGDESQASASLQYWAARLQSHLVSSCHHTDFTASEPSQGNLRLQPHCLYTALCLRSPLVRICILFILYIYQLLVSVLSTVDQSACPSTVRGSRQDYCHRSKACVVSLCVLRIFFTALICYNFIKFDSFHLQHDTKAVICSKGRLFWQKMYIYLRARVTV